MFFGVIACMAQTSPTVASFTLLVTNSSASHVSFVDSVRGVTAQVEVGAAPWGIALASNQRAYVSTAEGIALVDWHERTRLALIPYRAKIERVQYGEYRPGGMGIVASPDGQKVYIGVYLAGQVSQLEILDTKALSVIASVEIGLRPFDVLISRDGKQIFTIDHDSYSVTVVDTATLKKETIEVAPLGHGAFDKPHYAALDTENQLWLPYQGRALVRLNPKDTTLVTMPLTANTHQHGVAFTTDGQRLLIVGTGPAGQATQEPSLTMYDTHTKSEIVLKLARPHERMAVSPDGRWAYLTGGYLLSGGFDGLTIVDLQSQTTSELAVPNRPLDIVILR
jgi:YVTN family beta-propeller protein